MFVGVPVMFARILVACFATAILAAQPNPGGIVTHSLPITGPSMVYSVIDASGNVYQTTGVLPGDYTATPGAAQTQFGGGVPLAYCGSTPAGPAPCEDGIIAKADPTGKTIFVTFLGAPKGAYGSAIAVDPSGNVYIAGSVGASFPTTANAAIPTSTTSTTFAAKLSADGSKFLYATYLPETMVGPTHIAVDSGGNAYIAGFTDYAVGGVPGHHACVIKLSADGSTIVYDKVLAGSNSEVPGAALVDTAGNAYVAGYTTSPDFPVTPGVIQPQLAGAQNAFLTKLDPSGNILFSTFLGGSGSDSANALQIDANGSIYIAGSTNSLDFPTTPGSFEPSPLIPAWSMSAGGFIATLTPNAESLAYGSYLPQVTVLALTPSGDVYVAGPADGPGLPITPSAPEPCLGLSGGFLMHFDASGTLRDATYAGPAQAMTAAADGSVMLAAQGAFERASFGGPGWTAPACMTPALLNAATLSVTNMVPGTFATLVGFGIGPDNGVIAQPSAGGTPVSLGAVQVFFDGMPAPILYAQSQQVNVQMPFELSGKSSTSVTLNYNGSTFGPVTVALAFAGPGLFRLQPNVSAQALALNQDGTFNGPLNPAARGSVIMLLGTGFGATNPACPTGGLNVPGPANLISDLAAIMEFGGPVLYAGSAPTLPCGVEQINMQIPTDKPPGALGIYPWVATNNGLTFVETEVGSIIYIK
jgi:uncharacterized protein (TIGR03437 family)